MQSIAPSIQDVGSLLQWSANTTEHSHIQFIKNPASTSNNKDYNAQIYNFLDRHKKCHLFNDATTLLLTKDNNKNPDMGNKETEEIDNEPVEMDESSPQSILANLWSPKRQVTDFFKKAQHATITGPANIWPPCSFTACSTAIHLNYDPSVMSILIDEAVGLFSLPDLCSALADYITHEGPYLHHIHSIRQGRCAVVNAHLPFNQL